MKFKSYSLSNKGAPPYHQSNYYWTSSISTTLRKYSSKPTTQLITFSAIFILTLAILDYTTVRWNELEISQGFKYPSTFSTYFSIINNSIVKKHTAANNKPPPISLSPFKTVDFIKDESHFSMDKLMQETSYGLLIVVKSALSNKKKRDSIRKSWGHPEYLKYTQLSPDLPSKLVFISGLPSTTKMNNNSSSASIYEHLFPSEYFYRDIVLTDFVDSYGNNTYKSMLSLKWALLIPKDFQYLFLVDDDMYIDLVNLRSSLVQLSTATFVKKRFNTTNTFYYQKSTIYNNNGSGTNSNNNKELITKSGAEILKEGLFMGRVYWNARPLRPTWIFYQSYRSEWLIPLSAYAHDYYPTYTPGAAILFSKRAVQKLYFGSMFVKPFSVDDVYFGILALEVGITPLNNFDFHPDYIEGKIVVNDELLINAIAIHGLQCPEQMTSLWRNRNAEELVDC